MIKTPFRKDSLGSRYQSLINQINILGNDLKTLSNNELRAKSFKLKRQYQYNKNLEPLIAESFALTREASFRTLGLKHFDVQLFGGLVLNSRKIAEMKTGEGKTLVAALPASLNAITNQGVHIVTVNDYLASRDQVSMGQIYRFLGFSTGLIQDGMSDSERKEAYNADITYVTNHEVAFDFLRDNMAYSTKEVVLRPFYYCIIDEVDSILIDEAQTPLIISTNFKTQSAKYRLASKVVDFLRPNLHYKIDDKNRNVILTTEGNIATEALLGVTSLYDRESPWIPVIQTAIQAKTLFFKDIHYIIQENQIVCVDEFTGRSMPDRQWGGGLHQALEAKENLPISDRSESAASITYQNFFLLYPKLAGMTGTAKTSEIEFKNIYKLSVTQIPTAKPVRRKDLPDIIYKDQFIKWNSISNICNTIASKGQPVLIGTTSVAKSELLAQLLDEYMLSFKILNAKAENVRLESEIVAQAGSKDSITIATNIGRCLCRACQPSGREFGGGWLWVRLCLNRKWRSKPPTGRRPGCCGRAFRGRGARRCCHSHPDGGLAAKGRRYGCSGGRLRDRWHPCGLRGRSEARRQHPESG